VVKRECKTKDAKTFQRERRGLCVERKPLDVVVLRVLVAERTSTPPREREREPLEERGWWWW
jgi:hypothetical protein